MKSAGFFAIHFFIKNNYMAFTYEYITLNDIVISLQLLLIFYDSDTILYQKVAIYRKNDYNRFIYVNGSNLINY